MRLQLLDERKVTAQGVSLKAGMLRRASPARSAAVSATLPVRKPRPSGL